MNDASMQPLDKTVQTLMAHYGVPGVAVGVWHAGEETLAGYGVTNINHPLPVDGDTLFQIGSTTKTFTATVAVMLAVQGKLDLHAPIRTVLPEFRLQDGAASAHATLRHCFTHTGGWLGDYFEDTGDGDDALQRYVQCMADLPQQTPLGEIWSYNNAGFSLAGRVIEVVTGRPFEHVVHDMLLNPLGMDHSFFFAKDAIAQRVAVGHNVTSEGTEVALPWALARSAHSARGVISTARDQLRYARFHLGDGLAPNKERLLPAERLHAMQQPLVPAGNMAEAVGVSWLLRRIDGVPTVFHGGATNGQMSAFLLAPQQDFAVTVLTNADRGRELHRDFVNWALQHFLGLAEPEPEILPRTSEELERYAGYYEARLSHVEVTVAGDRLLVKTLPQGGFPHKDSPPGPIPPPSTLAFIDTDRLLFVDGPAQGGRAEIVRNAAGAIGWLRVGGRLHKRRDQQGGNHQ